MERLQRAYLTIIKKEIRLVERRVKVDLTLFHKVTKRNFIVMVTGEGVYIRALCQDGNDIQRRVIHPLRQLRQRVITGAGYTSW